MEPYEKHRDVHRAIRRIMLPRRRMDVVSRKVLPVCCPMRYTRVLLPKVFAELGYSKGAEIGVRAGNYTALICEANPNLEMYCVDSWAYIDSKYPSERQEKLYRHTLKKLEPFSNVRIVRKTSMEAVKEFEDGYLDFVYIDANHHFDYVMLDILFWKHKVRSGGIIACHDFYHGETGVVKAVEAHNYSNHIIPWYTTKESQPTAFWVNP